MGYNKAAINQWANMESLKVPNRKKVRDSVVNLTKDKRSKLRAWALKHSEVGAMGDREYRAVGTWFLLSSWAEQLDSQEELAKTLSGVLNERYGPPPSDRKMPWVAKQTIGPHIKMETRGELNDRALEAIGVLLNLERGMVYKFLIDLGAEVLGEGNVDHVPLGL